MSGPGIVRRPARRALGRPAALAAAMLVLASIAARAQDRPLCTVTSGTGALLIRATVLLPDHALERGEVLVGGDGRIACVGEHCDAAASGAAVLDCGAAVLSPGLINTHDHLAFTGIAPHPDSGERFAHRHEWRKGLDGHRALETFTASHDPRVLSWGELRFLVGGTTSTVGGDMAPGLLRNLDVASGLEGLPARPVSYKVFPLDDASGIMRTADCDYGHHPSTRADVAASGAFLAHVAEGTDAAARNEFRCESSLSYDRTKQPGGGGTSDDWIIPQATLIHAVALTPADLALVARRHAAIVWSPRSNLSLYGRTLNVLEAHRLGIPLALGSDWLPSGSMNLNRELVCAASYNREALGNALSTRDLWRMVTIDAARAVHDEDLIGSIAPGQVADLALFAPGGRDPYAAVVDATPFSVILVLRGGQPIYGQATVMDALRPGCDRLDLPGLPPSGAERRLCAEPHRLSAPALERFAADHALYPLAFPGTPLNEPSCSLSDEGQAPDR
ncbi:amidohydrolase family protein [Acetobacteraceae bacterium KSS8]|uniref:Amidohydrolase family protein n=1 Tax=Endosaccharibacter trunci TaxID=2812733 RepID=A0ABT1W386_9PROT|nr:amidohydrolase family protein [Acetobacteraceae bacterium KSS8]